MRAFLIALCLISLSLPQLVAQQANDFPTVEEAAKLLDLRTFPTHEKAKGKVLKAINLQEYAVDSNDAKEVFAWLQKELAGKEWKDTVNPPFLSASSASATFSRGGYTLLVSIFQRNDKEGKYLFVTMTNNGNLDVTKLYVPKTGVKLFGSSSNLAYEVESTVEDARKEVREELLKTGWEPYGAAANIQMFKKNAIKLDVGVYTSSGAKKKTNVSYLGKLMTIDLPAPADAKLVNPSDNPRQLFVVLNGAQAAAEKYYDEVLGKKGWKASGAATNEGITKVQKYENAAKEVLGVKYIHITNKNETHVTLVIEEK